MTSYLPMARLIAATITALSVISVPLVASAASTIARPLLNTERGDVQLGESVLTGRYQQVFPDTSFYLTEPFEIHEIRLRPQSPGSFSVALSDVQISLGYTDARPLSMSDRFEDNEGSAPSVVYSGALDLHSNGASMRPWRDFDLVVDLQDPFTYDPSEGSLLLEWDNRGSVSSGGVAPNFDAISTRFGSLLAASGGAEIGEISQGGLSARFSDGTVPEPTGALLFAIGTVVTLARRRHA